MLMCGRRIPAQDWGVGGPEIYRLSEKKKGDDLGRESTIATTGRLRKGRGLKKKD